MLKRLAKIGGLEVAVKGKIGGHVSFAQICCSAQDGDVMSTAASIAGDVEVDAKWNWLKGSEFLKQFTGDTIDVGAYTKLKLFGGVGTGGELFWDDCERRGSGQLRYSFGVALSLIDTTLKTTVPVNGQDVKCEFTVVDTGATYANAGSLTPASARAANDLSDWNYAFFFKFGEYKFGDFKFALVNISFSDSGTINEVTQFATQ